MPQNHFREPKNRREHLLSSLPIVLPVAAVTISAAAFGLLFLQGDLVESAEETVTYTAAIGADDEQVEMYVYDAGNDEVEETEEEASEMNAASSYAAKERILPAGEVEDTAELVDAYSSVPLFVSSGNLAEQGVQTRLELLEDLFSKRHVLEPCRCGHKRNDGRRNCHVRYRHAVQPFRLWLWKLQHL